MDSLSPVFETITNFLHFAGSKQLLYNFSTILNVSDPNQRTAQIDAQIYVKIVFRF